MQWLCRSPAAHLPGRLALHPETLNHKSLDTLPQRAATAYVRGLLVIDLNATLPQAPGYPGSAQATAHITIAKSRWEQELAQLGPSAAFEMAVPYPLGDPERDEVGRTLREAQRLLTVGEVRASILEVRRALEWVRENVTWDNPGSRKQANQCNQTERWWRIQDALYGQTCGALHNDGVTKTFKYDRAEAETLLAMTSALLRNVPVTSA
ncbi:hypothetical protein ACIBVL_25520 [Streptomyces sp. NPDC049687]|uniref:hypothetical protein n=1 Tax=Streptomyces sp. NPDC049687 TaxID=3365596 RepID=UPI0037ABBF4C